MSSDSPFDVDLVTNLVRRQGEVLLRVQKELGQAQGIEAASNEALVATERRLEILHRASSQCHARLKTLTQEFITLQSENEVMLMELDEALAGIRTVMTVPGSSLTSNAQTVEPSSSFQAIDPVANAEDIENRISAFEESLTDVSVDSSFEADSTGRDEMEEPQPTSTSNVLDLNSTNGDAALNVEPVADFNSTNGRGAPDFEPVAEPELLEVEPHPDSEHYEIVTRVESPHPELEVSKVHPSEEPQHTYSGKIQLPRLSLSSVRVEPIMAPTAAASVKVLTPGSSRSMPPAPSSNLPSSSTQVASSNANNAKIEEQGPEDAHFQVFGTTAYQILKNPKTVVKPPNSQDELLITVSKYDTILSSKLTKFDKWTGHILLHNTKAGDLYYLGQYGCGPTSRIDGKEYDSLPDETKQYILNSAKSIRHSDIKTEEHLISSIGAAHGIYVAKTKLRFPRYNETFEKELREEARKRGYV
ncbi:hypothetical protein GYMLUDRAFT_243010 [Collybiopsis luxurians FD-317 M1]|uniref:Uncharacterized protein n=1 Tax=Collybiopsis luxurians FD-317 M1 TaxID=944289 RepID=A0A0D0BDN0_9AGAR|nr:hypothetical protein GYMLUDRAFT_243010 [Collybiopsis luxurians FD-317 M1]